MKGPMMSLDEIRAMPDGGYAEGHGYPIPDRAAVFKRLAVGMHQPPNRGFWTVAAEDAPAIKQEAVRLGYVVGTHHRPGLRAGLVFMELSR